jgi:hypothetical protein
MGWKKRQRPLVDVEMRKMADRIQARAIDRVGELMRSIPKASGGNQSKKGTGPLFASPREQARVKAGLSKDQVRDAVRINNIPRDEFEAAVESDNPPTIKALAKKGTKKRKQRPLLDLGDWTPEEFAAAT